MADADLDTIDPDPDPDSDADPAAPYVPDIQSLWGSEKSRAILVVLTRRLGPDFAREVHNELYARSLAYVDGGGDDRRDGQTLEGLLEAPIWDELFAMPEPKA